MIATHFLSSILRHGRIDRNRERLPTILAGYRLFPEEQDLAVREMSRSMPSPILQLATHDIRRQVGTDTARPLTGLAAGTPRVLLDHRFGFLCPFLEQQFLSEYPNVPWRFDPYAHLVTFDPIDGELHIAGNDGFARTSG